MGKKWYGWKKKSRKKAWLIQEAKCWSWCERNYATKYIWVSYESSGSLEKCKRRWNSLTCAPVVWCYIYNRLLGLSQPLIIFTSTQQIFLYWIPSSRVPVTTQTTKWSEHIIFQPHMQRSGKILNKEQCNLVKERVSKSTK